LFEVNVQDYISNVVKKLQMLREENDSLKKQIEELSHNV